MSFSKCSKRNIKLFVNAFIIIGGALATIIGIIPDTYVPQDIKLLLLNIGGVAAGALKALEKLFVENAIEK